MATGRQTLLLILREADAHAAAQGRPPTLIKLPVPMAQDLAKCRKCDLGELSTKMLKDLRVIEKEGLRGMRVQINRAADATLQFE